VTTATAQSSVSSSSPPQSIAVCLETRHTYQCWWPLRCAVLCCGGTAVLSSLSSLTAGMCGHTVGSSSGYVIIVCGACPYLCSSTVCMWGGVWVCSVVTFALSNAWCCPALPGGIVVWFSCGCVVELGTSHFWCAATPLCGQGVVGAVSKES
jgi:hypothetical protein